MTDFDDIRPYNDEEVLAALARIVNDDECLNLIAGIKFPTLFKIFPLLLRPLLRWNLSRRVKGIQS